MSINTTKALFVFRDGHRYLFLSDHETFQLKFLTDKMEYSKIMQRPTKTSDIINGCNQHNVICKKGQPLV